MNKVVVFDMDGLMFDTEPIYFKANKKTAERLNIPFDYTFYEKYIGASEADFFAAMFRKFPDHNVEQFTIDSKKDVEELLVSKPPAMKKGLVGLLKFLKKNNYKTVVASSSERKLVEKLLSLQGLEKYFDNFIGGDEVVESKPHPEIFQKAVERVGNKESDVLVLEDSLNGIRAAYLAGYKVVMIPDLIQPTEEARTKTLEIVEDLEEILIKIKRENFF